MSETIVTAAGAEETPPRTAGAPARPSLGPTAAGRRAAPAKPDVEALQRAFVEAFFGILGAPDTPEALAAGRRVMRERDVALDTAPDAPPSP